VQSITFQTPEQSEQPSSFPNMSYDPFLPTSPSTVSNPQSATAESSMTASLTAKPIAPPTPALVELPTCPVCLERMDESTGLLIILCQHVFHCACLEKWKGSGCPVCRYTQNAGIPGITRGANSEDTENACSVCGSEQNLWICLICGNVGCGRYDSAHAFAHWEETNHSFAMDIATQHVWDYAGDGYVHRLIQNKGDGKLMDLPAAAGWPGQGKGVDGGFSAFGADMVPREKMEAMGNEYTYLLTNQLESQRLYYEEQLERAVDKASKAASAAEQAATTVGSLRNKLEIMESNHKDAMTLIAGLQKEIEKCKKRVETAGALARKFERDWKEEKVINESLMERIKFLDLKMVEAEEAKLKLEEEKKDLEEQNRDYLITISGAEKFQGAGEEIVEGTVEVAPQPESSTGKKKRGRGKR
jgi:BRCA1-associated protein